MKRYFKTEGNIIYPDKSMLIWGPFYYCSYELAKEKMPKILDDITEWCNLKDSSLNIKPQNIINATTGTQIVFKIKAWKDEEHLENCNGIITLEDILFEDEEKLEKEGVKVTIEELECGGLGTLIDCSYHASCLCPFCREYGSWFSETKEVTPSELVDLLKRFRYKIKLIQQ